MPGATRSNRVKRPVSQLNVFFQFRRHVSNTVLRRILRRFPSGVRLGRRPSQFRQEILKIVGTRHEIRFAIQFHQHRGLSGRIHKGGYQPVPGHSPRIVWPPRPILAPAKPPRLSQSLRPFVSRRVCNPSTPLRFWPEACPPTRWKSLPWSNLLFVLRLFSGNGVHTRPLPNERPPLRR
jgi:hypothetical protein